MKYISIIQKEFIKYADDLSGVVHFEREKRLTLNELLPEVKGIVPIIIKQGILREVRDNDGKCVVYARVRMKRENGDTKYILGVKNLKLQQESEVEISKEMFDGFFPDNVLKPQVKARYVLPNGWEIDKVLGKNEIYAEYEYDSTKELNDIKVPEHWVVK